MSEPSAVQTTAPVTPAAARFNKKLIPTLMAFVWLGGSLFLGAGRLDWIRGWITFALWIAGVSAVALIVQHYNPSVLQARAKWRRKDTKGFDKIFLAIYLPMVIIQPLLAGLDAGRYRWSSMPFAFVYIGVALFVLSLVLITAVMILNPFAESTVRIQTDRGHAVITSGPYRFVRHPMYVGMILMYVSTALILGSVWALGLACALAILLIWRTAREDLTLREELPGYQEFAAVTRYRLLPGVW
jgi:protein-S-isoprenylcysteine O-methyltransferase Ste14